MLRLWQSTQGNQATGNVLESALKQIGREDIVNKCMFNVEQVTDEMERLTAKEVLEDVSGFDAFKVKFQDIRRSVFKIRKGRCSLCVISLYINDYISGGIGSLT